MKATKLAKKSPEKLEELGFKEYFKGTYKITDGDCFINIDINTRAVDIFLGVPSQEKVEFIRKKSDELVKNGLAEYC